MYLQTTLVIYLPAYGIEFIPEQKMNNYFDDIFKIFKNIGRRNVDQNTTYNSPVPIKYMVSVYFSLLPKLFQNYFLDTSMRDD